MSVCNVKKSFYTIKKKKKMKKKRTARSSFAHEHIYIQRCKILWDHAYSSITYNFAEVGRLCALSAMWRVCVADFNQSILLSHVRTRNDPSRVLKLQRGTFATTLGNNYLFFYVKKTIRQITFLFPCERDILSLSLSRGTREHIRHLPQHSEFCKKMRPSWWLITHSIYQRVYAKCRWKIVTSMFHSFFSFIHIFFFSAYMF